MLDNRLKEAVSEWWAQFLVSVKALFYNQLAHTPK